MRTHTLGPRITVAQSEHQQLLALAVSGKPCGHVDMMAPSSSW